MDKSIDFNEQEINLCRAATTDNDFEQANFEVTGNEAGSCTF